MNRNIIKLNESDLNVMIKECVGEVLKEISADLADRAAGKAYQSEREGFGKYGQSNEIPFDSPHGKKFLQGEKFLKYRNDKLGMNDGIGIYYPNGDDSVMVLKNYNTGEILTKPCRSIKELEAEYNAYQASDLSEGKSFGNNQGYTHFAVNKATNKIVNGWDYRDIDSSELRQFKRDYFTADLSDMGLDPRQYIILTAKTLRDKLGIDPDDNGNWANS